MSVSAIQRVRQGLGELLAFLRPVDLALAAEFLSPEWLALFTRLNRAEQLHSLNVLRDVLAQGNTPRDLAVAALLHDIGKACYPLATWQKTYAVLARHFWPQAAARWQTGDARHFWLRPFVVRAQHPAWSADMMAAAGIPETAVWLAAHHADNPTDWQDHPHVHLLRRLQAADDAN
ncbi:MAG TPA: hypothetical protein VHO69_16665 [Phototrophicaceae bacterium]|nr:hypothetical protein [Phototrophicaceae bacterium]